MLHSRVVDYVLLLFDVLAYEERLFFDWGGWLAVRSMAELPYWRCLMQRQRDLPKTRRHVETHGDEVTAIRNLLEARGTLANRDFNAADRRAVTSYRGTKDSSLILYYLWLVGDAMTHHRDGFERVTRRPKPSRPRILSPKPAAWRPIGSWRARQWPSWASAGSGRSAAPWPARFPRKRNGRSNNSSWSPARSSPSKSKVGPAPASWSRKMWTFSATWRASRAPDAWNPIETTTEEEVTLLSPLDPVTERRRAQTLFGFEYVWEIYKKPDEVRFGRFAMPILWGDHLVGRTDLKTDRPSFTLVVNGVWLEAAAVRRRSWTRPRGGPAADARLPRDRPYRRDGRSQPAAPACDRLPRPPGPPIPKALIRPRESPKPGHGRSSRLYNDRCNRVVTWSFGFPSFGARGRTSLVPK